MNGKDLVGLSKKVVKTGKTAIIDNMVVDPQIAEAYLDWINSSNKAEKNKLLKMSVVTLLKTVNEHFDKS